MSLYSDVLNLVRRWKLFSGARSIIVGVSGGPDSVCLLDLLALMRERGDITVEIHAAHLNHGLRGDEADEDEQFVRELAESRSLPLTVDRRDVNAARTTKGGSVEEAARRERYAFLASAAERIGAEVVAVGHNADDQIETVLHRILRGAGLKGLRGIPISRLLARGSSVRLVRPLLHSRRAEIVEHLRDRGRSFRQDSSNRDTAFTRNRIRAELLPRIESEYNPAFGESLLRLSRSANDAYELLLDVAQTAAADCLSGASIDAAGFALVHGAARPLLIDAAVAAAAPGAPQFDAAHYDAVVDLALDGRRGARLDLPGGIVARRTETAVELSVADPPEAAPHVEAVIPVPGETRVPEAGLTITVEVVDRSQLDLDVFLRTKTRYDEALDFEVVDGPLVLRSRREGDTFEPLGAGGRRKVGDFLTDRKVPAAERGRVLILEAAGAPVWIVGYRIDERAKLTERTTRVLRLSVKNEG